MDFSFSEDQTAIRDLANQIFTDRTTDEFLLAFDRFPAIIPVYGSNFLSTVLAKCPDAATRGRNNQAGDEALLGLVLGDVAPKLLAVNQLKVEVALLHKLLYMTIDHLGGLLGAQFHADTSNPAPKTADNAKDPWVTILSTLEEIGLRMGWSLTEELTEVTQDALWQRIQTFAQKMMNSKGNMDLVDELFFVAMLAFLRSLSDYAQKISETKEAVEAGLEEPSAPMLMVEGFVTHSEEESKPKTHPKRRRTTEDERRIPLLTQGGSKSGCQNTPALSAFMKSLKYHELLSADPALEAKLQQLKGLNQHLAIFYADVALYQGNFREALKILRVFQPPASRLAQCRHHLKLATLHYVLGASEHSNSAEHLISAVASLPEKKPGARARRGRGKGSGLNQPTVKHRHVHLLPFTRDDILAYVTRLMVVMLKDRGLNSMTYSSELSLGHVIVLLQYVYPEEVDQFNLVLHRIRMKGSFSYPLFSQYVVHIEFLEEFAHLIAESASGEGNALTLDIAPGLGNNPRRMGTRGEKRGEKEEVRAVIQKQVGRSHLPMDEVVVEFLTGQKDSILQCMMA